MPATPADAYAELTRRARDVSLLSSAAAVLGWDERTYMPAEAADLRGEQLGLLARLAHEKATDPRVGELLAAAESPPPADPLAPEAVNVREWRRAYDRAVKIPPRLVEELAKVTTSAQQAWQEARAARHFAGFKPWLEKVVALKREEADAVGHGGNRYDALLDEYEPGATAATVAQLFAALAAELTPLVQLVTSAKRQPRADLLDGDFPPDRQAVFGEAAAAAVGFRFAAGRLDVTAHPFCTGVGPGDCRITSRYHPRRFGDGFFGILHEAGHGIYEQNLAAGGAWGTPMGEAASLGVHESQSRLWENQVGRSRPFWEHFLPRARQTFAPLRGVQLDDWVFAVNAVRPSFIRVEADEATYNLHVILRFELEQVLLSGDLPVDDVPSAWNEEFRRLLGITPPDDAQGCLQDIHWSFGGVGYFPTYTIGNVLAAQFMAQARADLPELDGDFRRGEFGRMADWLRDRIHRHGKRFRSADLCQSVTGSPPQPGPLLDALRSKYAELYGLP